MAWYCETKPSHDRRWFVLVRNEPCTKQAKYVAEIRGGMLNDGNASGATQPVAHCFLSRYKVRVALQGQGAVRLVHRKRRNDRRRRWKISLCATSMDDAFPIDSTDTTGVFSHVSLCRLCVKKQEHPHKYVRISWSVRFRGWTFGNAVRGMRWRRVSRDTTRILIVSRGSKDVCRVGEKEIPVTLTGVGRYSN